MPIFGPDFVEGKVYRGKKKTEEDEERLALSELQSILNSRNRRSCDCEAQVHELLENCLNCGRLTCTAEGPGKCFSCGSIVLDEKQRERLQKHIDIVQSASSRKAGSSSNSRRSTQIIDNQFDYFAVDSKKHLSESEKQILRSDIEDLRNRRYQRKLILNVDIDNLKADAESVRVVENYEEEMRRLQIKDQPMESTSHLRLFDLVQRESRKNYNFEYIDSNTKRKPTPRHLDVKSTPSTKDKDQKKTKEKKRDVKNDCSKSAWNMKDKKRLS